MSTPLHSPWRLLAGLLLLVLPACQTVTVPPPMTAPMPAPVGKPEAASSLFEWNGGDLTGAVAMKIDLSEQKAEITRGGQPAGWTYVATGVSNHPTPRGAFRISEKARYKHSTSWGKVVDADGDTVIRDARSGRDAVPPGGRFVGASMPFWMRVTGAVGMHAGPIPDPGSPASHGCIRLPRGMAEILFGVAEIGTPVQIVP